MASRLYLICTCPTSYTSLSLFALTHVCYILSRGTPLPHDLWICYPSASNVPVTQFLILFRFLLKWHQKSCSELCASFILLCFFLYNTVFERNFRFCIFLIYLFSFSSCLNISPQRTGTLSCWLFTQYKLPFDVVIIIALSLQTRKLKSPERSE